MRFSAFVDALPSVSSFLVWFCTAQRPTQTTSGMLHHPGVSLSEQSTCRWDHTCWHAAIYPAGSATMDTHVQGRVLHSNYVAYRCDERSTERKFLKLLWLAPGFLTRLTPTAYIDLSGSKLPCVLRTHHLRTLRFLSSRLTRYTWAFSLCEIFECALLQFTVRPSDRT